MQKLISEVNVPPNRFTFVCPDTGYRVRELSLGGMFDKIERHYKDNELSLPDNWKEIVEDRLCQSLPPGWCRYTDGRPGNGSHCRVDADMIVHGIQSLSKLVWEQFTGQDVFVSQDEADQRAEICAKCQLNVNAGICMSCGMMEGVLRTVGKIKGNRNTKWDGMLQNCCVCGCRNEAIVHIRKDILQTGESEDMKARRPAWCWMLNQPPQEALTKLAL